MGASVIEKHFTLDRKLPGPDHLASLEPNELKKMIVLIRNIENEEYGEGTHFVFSSFYYSGVYSLGKILETIYSFKESRRNL